MKKSDQRKTSGETIFIDPIDRTEDDRPRIWMESKLRLVGAHHRATAMFWQKHAMHKYVSIGFSPERPLAVFVRVE